MLYPESSLIIINLFPRLLGIIYFFAFFPFLFQIRGLMGEKGILPLGQFLDFYRYRLGKRRFVWLPTLFWFDHSDAVLMAVPAAGTALALLLIFGVAPWALLPLLILLHLSIVTAGQDFLSFGWEGFLLELSYHAFFLSLTPAPNLFVWWSVNLLIFRVHLQAGTSKLQSGDPSWKNLTALCYHYQTQPIPNPVAWYIHKWPPSFHRISALLMLGIEIGVPFFLLGPDWLRLSAFFLFFFLQFSIAISGNYSYLNYLTVVMCTLLIGDRYLIPLFGPPPSPEPSFWFWEAAAALGGIGLLGTQGIALYHHFFRTPLLARILSRVYPYHLGNRFAIFAVMTTTRYEVVVEGSEDQKQWKEYLFKYKPSETTARPRWIAPYQPRLDWQAWFLPFEDFSRTVWFQQFLNRLLEGSPEVLKLLRYNPFPDSPPSYIRTKLYVYEYTDWKRRKATGEWWTRRLCDSCDTPILLQT